MFDLSKIMREAHARAREDFAFAPSKPYRYYLGLQMRSGFAEQREQITGLCAAFTIQEPAAWLGSRK